MAVVDVSNLDAVILCGGKGTRLQSVVSDRPKGLALISGKPFIDILLGYLEFQKVRRVILCTGYLKEQYEDYFKSKKNLDIIFSAEDKPLGTGGAIKNAIDVIGSESFFVFNGDSICDVDLSGLYKDHNKYECALSIVLSSKTKGSDYGNVHVDKNNRILSFTEKNNVKTNVYINTGIYLMSRNIHKHMPEKDAFSIEKDFFPDFVKGNTVLGHVTNNEVYDIGTPERYSKYIDSNTQ